MSGKTYDARIKHKRDTSANWTNANPVLLSGEIVVVDTGNGVRTKTGDGSKRYSQLPFDDEALRSLISGKVSLSQGTTASGKILSVGTDGNVRVRALKCESGIDVNINDSQITISHASSGATAGTYGSTSNQIPSFGETINVPAFSITTAGHVTSAGTYTAKIPNTTATTSAPGLMSASDKSKLDGIDDGAKNITVDDALSSSSTNPVQNKAVNTAINSRLPTAGGTMTGTITFGSNGKMVLGSSLYGTSLPSSGTAGQIFFKKA